MKPYIHAKNSVRKYGGQVSDYLPIHNEMDSTKSAMPDVRHRAIYHTSFGIYIIEKIFGEVITNSDGKEVSVRDIAEQHVVEDLGFIPTLENFLQFMTIEDWMIRPALRKKKGEVSAEEVTGDLDLILDSKKDTDHIMNRGKRPRGFRDQNRRPNGRKD